MKIVVINNLHGESLWQNIIAKEFNSSDKIIFLGNYFDSYEKFTSEEELTNYLNIISYKKQFPNKIELLIGKHDHHYNAAIEKSEQYNTNTSAISSNLLDTHTKDSILKICHLEKIGDKNYLFSNLGISKTFLAEVSTSLFQSYFLLKNYHTDLEWTVDCINNLYVKKPYMFNFCDTFGHDLSHQSPLHISLSALISDILENYIQVIGISKHNLLKIDSFNIVTDSLLITPEIQECNYLVINDDDIQVKNITINSI